MADPATVVGLVGASLAITVRAAKIGKYLYSLKSKFRKAEASVQQVSTHVTAIRVAARALSAWMEDDTVDEEKMEEVKEELLQVLIACHELLTDLEGYVVQALAGADKIRFGGRVSYLWNEKVIKETSQTLHQQETALILILNVLNKERKSQQREQLQEPQNQKVLANAKNPSSSIFGLKDGQSQSVKYSVLSENSENLDMVFSFDLYLMASPVYRKWMTSMTRQKIHQGKASRQDPNENDEFVAATVVGDQSETEDDTDTFPTTQEYFKTSEIETEPKFALSQVATNEPLKPSAHQQQIPRSIADSRWDQVRKNAAERPRRLNEEERMRRLYVEEQARRLNEELIARIQVLLQ